MALQEDIVRSQDRGPSKILAALGAAVVCAVFPAVAESQDSVRVLAFGDSITWGYGADGVECYEGEGGGYPSGLQTRLRHQGVDATVANFGLCGEKTAAGVTRIESVLATGGDAILIMEGTNDLSPFCCVGYESILFNLDQMARKALAAGVEPLIASVVPIDDPEGNEAAEILGEALAAETAAAGYVFADPFHALAGVPDLFELYYFNFLHPNSAGYALVADSFVQPAMAALACGGGASGPCVPGEDTLCLAAGRFRVTVVARDFDGVAFIGNALPQTSDTGAFWLFDPDNVELVVKVLDGRSINDHFWVFYGSLSNVEFDLEITDTETGTCKKYRNTSSEFASVGDTSAFFIPAPPG